MPILTAIAIVLGGALFFYFRLRATRNMALDVADMAEDARLAARRFGFRRKLNQNPVDAADDARITAMGLLVIVAEADGTMSSEEQKTIVSEAVRVFNCTGKDAEELLALGRWMASITHNRSETQRRLVRRTVALGGKEVIPDLIAMVQAVASADGKPASDISVEICERLTQLKA